MTDFIYDIETYPNLFSCIIHGAGQDKWVFEVSDRRNDLLDLVAMMHWMAANGHRMVGFNNLGFDYPVIHFIMQNYTLNITVADIYKCAMQIIATPFNQRFSNRIKPWEVMVPQVDLYLIHHFDNVNRSTSLKVLEFNMQSRTIEDLPFPVGTILTSEQIDVVLKYNDHDVSETGKFYIHSKPMIDFRDALGPEWVNYNDTKIGKQYFINQLEAEIPGACYTRINGRKIPRQTPRDSIPLDPIIFPYVHFNRPEFSRVLDFLRAQVITETKAVFDDLSCTIYGLTYHFGAGGIHASVESQTVRADADHCIIDLDVTSYYPSLAIANNLYPEHLGQGFCDTYARLKAERQTHKKGSAPNAMLKLALNGVYGDSNNQYSPFYDPRYTMSITINGQLLLCMLAELLLPICDLDIIQVNTDGLTVRCRRDDMPAVQAACDWWQRLTLLTLETVEYNVMHILNVNNYCAVTTSGKVKRKGVYQYNKATSDAPDKLGWHQKHSALVVKHAANAALLDGVDVRDFITNHINPYDFVLCAKLNRTSELLHGQTKQQNTSRYFISTDGDYLTKLMPPLKKTGKTEMRRFAINKGFTTTMCNDMADFDRTLINFEWYIDEAHKLMEPLI